MNRSPYAKYVKSMVEHGERRITEINWLFESVDRSLKMAERNHEDRKRSRAYISLRHAKNLTGFLQRSLGDLPDPKLVKHLHDFFNYVDGCLDTSLRLPIYNELADMRQMLKELHVGWLHLVSPIRGEELREEPTRRIDASG